MVSVVNSSVVPETGDIRISVTFYPPDRRGDRLNYPIRMKAYWDGIADALGVNDRRFLPVYHFAEPVSNASTGWVKKCPSTHPYLIPQFTIGAFYSIGSGDDVSLWKLSSDMPGMYRGQSVHFDYLEAWDTLVKDMWEDNCIGKKLNCSGGDLGNGKQLVGADHPKYGWTNPNRLVAIAARAAP